MGNALIPCPSCRRHVRMNEGTCRFCAAVLPSDPAAVPGLRGRLPRGAVFAFASTLAVTGCGASVTGCGASTEAPTTDTGVDTGGAVGPVYGAPADTGGPEDGGGNMSLYGAPADTGVADTGPEDSGGSAALYGAPADSGK